MHDHVLGWLFACDMSFRPRAARRDKQAAANEAATALVDHLSGCETNGSGTAGAAANSTAAVAAAAAAAEIVRGHAPVGTLRPPFHTPVRRVGRDRR